MKTIKTAKKQKLKESKGITLIALVITIIVLLILAGVTIATLTGNNGLLTKANHAKTETTEAGAKEQVQIATMGSYGSDGKIDRDSLKENLKNIKGLTYNGESISSDTSITSMPIVVELDNIRFSINENGEVNKVKTLEDYKVAVGDYVAYDEGKGYLYSSDDELGTGVALGNNYHITQGTIETEDMNWRVLGVNPDGNLELISDRPTSSELYIAGWVGYLNLEKNLNDFCDTLYGHGNFAIRARSLNIDDCYKLAGGEPSNEEKRQRYSRYGYLYQFRYSNSSGKVQSRKSENDGETWSNWEDTNSTSFCYPEKGYTWPGGAENETFTVKDNYYVPYTLLYNKGGIAKELALDCGESWLANQICNVQNDGGNPILGGETTHGGPSSVFYLDRGSDSYSNSNVRPIVVLNSNVKVDTNSTDGKTPKTAFGLKEE